MKKFATRLTPIRILFLLSMLVMSGCIKTGSLVADQPGNRDSAITAMGTPIGDPVTKTIGASGGAIASPDGRLQLEIPAGALTGNTEITVQPVSNEAPGGLGSAYQLLPEGIAFSKPVTITYHYTDEEVNGSHPFFLSIAYQDSTLSWHTDRKNIDRDTLAKTISISSTHFSIWSLMDNIKLYAPKTSFRLNETGTIEVQEIISGEDVGDGLAALATAHPVPDNIVSNWSIRGHGVNSLAYGQIAGNGSLVEYVSPSLIDQESKVQVSAEVKYHLIVYNKGKKIAEFNKFILFIELTLVPDNHSYTLLMELRDDVANTDIYQIEYNYYDHAKMDIRIAGDSVYISNIVNYPPLFTIIKSGKDCNYSVLDNDIGELNIDSAYGYADANTLHAFNFRIISRNGYYPKYGGSCKPSNINNIIGGELIAERIYGTRDFKLEDITQTNYNDEIPDEHNYVKYTITPK
jgi:hypothetical protein